MMKSKNLTAGYTLIELMIVLVILGLLASWAVPSYFQFVRDSRRADAMSSLNRMLAQQELFYSNNLSNYTLFVTSLGYNAHGGDNNEALSEEGYYVVEIAGCDDGSNLQSCIKLEATPVADKSQAKDTACAAISINSRGRQFAHASGSSVLNSDCWN